jgi:hypothetical protein
MGDKKDFLLMNFWKDFIFNSLGQEQWMTVYQNKKTEYEHVSFYCALVPNDKVSEALTTTDWELSYGDGMPGCSVTGYGEKEIVNYDRYGVGNNIEPLIIVRDFHGIKESYVEVSEEFRYYHNLFEDRDNGVFIKIKDNGDDEEIVTIDNETVRIQVKAIRQFLALKAMSLAVYFTIDRHTVESLQMLGIDEVSINEGNSEFKYYFLIRNWRFSGKYKTHSRLMGKRIIPGYSINNSGIWPYAENRQYIDFITGMDEQGEMLTYTSNPDELANYFGANPHAPHFLTAIAFNREVLRKYLGQPEKYSVEDGYLRCGGLWGVPIDNNHQEVLSVFLGDLGRLPYEEQIYWRSFNLASEGKISEVNFKRSFLAEFTEPTNIDLVLKSNYQKLQENWLSHFGWNLFDPLTKGDQHYYETLQVPITNDQSEFDKQILAMAKLFVDAISISSIQHFTGIHDQSKPIILLECLFNKLNITEYNPHLEILRKLYEIRSSGIGHRKGKNFTKISKYYELSSENTISVVEKIMMQLNNVILFIINNCLPQE